MFVRVKTTPNSPRKSVQIVHSIRKGKKISQKILRNVGIAADDKELEQLKILAESIKTKLERDSQPPLFSPEVLDHFKKIRSNYPQSLKPIQVKDAYQVNLKDIIEEDRVISGIHDIYGTLFNEMGYDKVFPSRVRQSNTGVVVIFRDIVLGRVANPLSKTTLYFESFGKDELCCLGYSKDMNFNQPQVLLTLLVTRKGLPVGYKVFQGDTYEGHTLVAVLQELRMEYRINRAVLVADSGMHNRANLEFLESKGFE